MSVVQRSDPSYNIETVAKIYALACEEHGSEWAEYEKWVMPTQPTDKYIIFSWIGTGKYSDVFMGRKDDKTSTVYAIKVLKPVRTYKYAREAKILLDLRDCPQIVRLIDILQNPRSKQYSFVFEYLRGTRHRNLFSKISQLEARFYLFQLITALQFAHSRGIMHRDVKPHNVLYNEKTKEFKLIDWGLSDFYKPGTRYGIHVASRSYKPIELLVDYQCYDYSLDIWSFGITMAEIIFRKSPFIVADSDYEMLELLINLLGKEELDVYLTKYGLSLPKEVEEKIDPENFKSFESYINETNRELFSDDALDLIKKCMKYDHTQRLTAVEVLKHPYFDPVRDLKPPYPF